MVVCANIIPILQMRKTRLRKVRLLVQGCRAEKPRFRIQVSVYLCLSKWGEGENGGIDDHLRGASKEKAALK